MAKTDTATLTVDAPKKKKKKAVAGAEGKVAKVKAPKADKLPKPKKAKAEKSDKAGKAKRAHRSDALDGLSKFVDHPLVADLLAAGAMAAVAAIAEHQLKDDKKAGSSKMVKSVGKAAATAMGRKLMGDIGAITTAATEAAKKA